MKNPNRSIIQVALGATYGDEPGSGFQAIEVNEGLDYGREGENTTRNTLRTSISPRGSTIGTIVQSLSIPCELRGAGAPGGTLNTPELDALLQASAMTREDGAFLVVTGGSGNFEVGETVTNTTASNTAGTVVHHFTKDGTTYLLLRLLQNMPGNGDALSGGTSGATATVSTADTGYCYRPFTPDDVNYPHCVIRYHMDDIKHVLVGARCSVSFSLSNGGIPEITIAATGLDVDPIDEDNPDVTYNTIDPDPVYAAHVKLGDTDLSEMTVTNFAFDLANQVQQRNDMQAAAGLRSLEINDREPNGSIDPEVTDLSNFDPWTDWKNATKRTIAVAIGLGTQGRRICLVVPNAQNQTPGYSNRNGVATYELPFLATGDDDEFLLFYA